MCLDPCHRTLEFRGIENSVVDATQELRHVDRLDPHAEETFEQGLINDGSCDPHRNAAHREIRLPAHGGDRQPGTRKSKNLLLHILRYRPIVGILDILPVNPEGRQPFLGVSGKHCGKVHRAGPLRTIESPDGLGYQWIHVHGLRAIAPARSNRNGDADTLSSEFSRGGGGLRHAANRGVRNHALNGSTIRMTERFRDQLRDRLRLPHGLIFQGFAYAAQATVNRGSNADARESPRPP